MQGVLIFYYVGGAGAKFIVNCLTYSGQVAFANYSIACRKDPVEFNRALLATVPDRAHSRSWLDREHGCVELYGSGITRIKTPDYPYPTDDTLNDLTPLADQWLPIMTHYSDELARVQEYFRDYSQRVIAVDATPEFIDRAIRLKWPEQSHCLDLDQYKRYQAELSQVQVDYHFVAWDPTRPNSVEQIIAFARTLDIELDLTAAQDYITKYIDFHG